MFSNINMYFDSAWIPEENIYLYSDHRDKFKLEKRVPKGFKEALEAIEDELKEKPFIVSVKIYFALNEIGIWNMI